MDGEKFQNDESGGLFFNFLLAFVYDLLVPVTYYFWPRKDKLDLEKPKQECRCDPCQIKKYNKTRQNIKNNIVKIILIGGWLILLFSSYKLSLINYDLDDDFDPFDILQVSPSATKAEIKKSYHDKLKIYHFDKETGDMKTFMLLNKAYQILTDKEAWENWEKYFNPAGLRAIKIGFAFPSWIVNNQKISILVLGAYALILFIIPTLTFLGIRRYKHSDNEVLLKTQKLYASLCSLQNYCIPLNRIIMILSSSYQFHKDYNNEMQDRESDNIELSQLNKKIPNLGEMKKETPFCYPYAIKARTLILAHLSRILLPAETLHKDSMYIVGKCPSLLQEMINVTAKNFIIYCKDLDYEYFERHEKTKVSLTIIETVDNMMKLCPLIVQGLWKFRSPFLQLPHIKEENIKWFSSKKRNIDSLQQLAKLDSKDRQAVLKGLNDEQYADVMKVLERMPYIELQVTTEVINDKEIRAEIVKVSLTLERKNMGVLFRDQHHKPDKKYDDHDWGNFLRNILGKEKVRAISTKSHSVHCPYFPDDKPEYWWVYICDKNNKKLKTEPYHITNLVEKEKVQLQFLAPSKPGVYTFTVCLRSDSYLGFDQMHDITLDINEARDNTVALPQWNFEVEEEELDSDNSDETGFINDDDSEEELLDINASTLQKLLEFRMKMERVINEKILLDNDNSE